MNQNYNTNYTKNEINIILDKIKNCITNNNFTISFNEKRIDNINFINEYNINSIKQKNILLKTQTEDFCYSLPNIKPGYEYEVLYVFAPQVKLYNVDDIEKNVTIYTKYNIIEKSDGNRLVVISFHEIKKTIDYLFR